MPQSDELNIGHKYPFNACEILCSENSFIIDKLIENTRLQDEDEDSDDSNIFKKKRRGYYSDDEEESEEESDDENILEKNQENKEVDTEKKNSPLENENENENNVLNGKKIDKF